MTQGYSVRLTVHAVSDIEDIYTYIAKQDGVEKANHILCRIEKTIASLASLLERGVYPKELAVLGIHDYREVFFKPYRIVYSIRKKTIYILLLADGRRDMQTALQRRLLQ